MRHIEHTLQRNMVNLFRMAYPQYKGVFFAVPNGGHRDIRVAQHMKAEGQLAGVSDLLLLVARKGMHGLCIEVKTKTGRQSERQKAFADAVIAQGYYYAIVRTLDEFIELCRWYLSEKPKAILF